MWNPEREIIYGFYFQKGRKKTPALVVKNQIQDKMRDMYDLFQAGLYLKIISMKYHPFYTFMSFIFFSPFIYLKHENKIFSHNYQVP